MVVIVFLSGGKVPLNPERTLRPVRTGRAAGSESESTAESMIQKTALESLCSRFSPSVSCWKSIGQWAYETRASASATKASK